jgi:integrase
VRASSHHESRLVQYGRYWLAKRSDSPYFYVCWYDKRRRQVGRQSTGLTDFKAAEITLGKALIAKSDSVQTAVELDLHCVLLWYWENHAKAKSGASSLKGPLGYWADFFPTGQTVKELSRVDVQRFWESLRADGLSEGSISRITAIGRAAIRRAHHYGLVPNPILIPDNQDSLSKLNAPPKGRVLTDEEMVRLFAVPKPEFLHVFLMILANTLCRTGAALDLGPAQVDFKRGIVDLNPKGRRQTKKYRPKVPLTRTLRTVLENIHTDRYVSQDGAAVTRIYPAWHKMLREAGFEPNSHVTPYSFRHTLGSELTASAIRDEDIGRFLGHMPRDSLRTTEIYTHRRPEYLGGAADAIDRYMSRTMKLA